MKITAQEIFNNGITKITVSQTAMNMWIVWREDNGFQALVKQYTNREQALDDYKNRCDFLRKINLRSENLAFIKSLNLYDMRLVNQYDDESIAYIVMQVRREKAASAAANA